MSEIELRLTPIMRVRAFRTRVVHALRARLGLYKNEARDRLINGAVRDNEALAKALAAQSRVVADLYARLAFYEKKIPAVMKARSAYDAEVKRRIKKAQKAVQADRPPHLEVEP